MAKPKFKNYIVTFEANMDASNIQDIIVKARNEKNAKNTAEQKIEKLENIFFFQIYRIEEIE